MSITDNLTSWLTGHFHTLVLLLLLIGLLSIVLHLIHRGMNPENMDWAKEQIAAVLGALLYSLQPARNPTASDK